MQSNYIIFKGGWLMVGNLSTTKQGESVAVDGELKYGQKVAELEKAVNGQFLFTASQYALLREYTQFSEIRLFCHKPSHGRTVDVAITVDDQIYNYLLDKKSSFGYCDKTYRPLPADNSLVSRLPCEELSATSYGYSITGAIFFKRPLNYIIFDADFPRFDCDDQLADDLPGEWRYYVRWNAFPNDT